MEHSIDEYVGDEKRRRLDCTDHQCDAGIKDRDLVGVVATGKITDESKAGVATSSNLAKPGADDKGMPVASLADEGIGVLSSHGSHSLPSLPVELLVMPNDTAITRLSAAASEDMGRRPTMEDVHIIKLDVRSDTSTGNTRLSFFGIWDGHGGVDCARFASETLNANAIKAGLISLKASGKPDAKAAKLAITEAFRLTDEALLRECSSRSWSDGACAVCCWILEELCVVANVGDAKAVLARKSPTPPATDKSSLKAVTLTREHLALHASERARIERAGGFVSSDGRLNGRMQVSRSFGDAALKKVGCSSVPDVTAFELTDRDQFLVLGCDGFWGAWDAQGCVDAAASLIAEGGRDDKGVTNKLLNIAVRERGAKDNCSVLIVRMHRTLSK